MLPDTFTRDEIYDLLVGAKSGCVQSQEQIYKRAYPLVLHYTLNRTRDRSEAEDITQETFIRWLARLEYINVDPDHPGQTLFRYLYTTVNHILVDNSRVYKRIAGEDVESYDSLESDDAMSDILNDADLEQRRECIWSAISALPTSNQRKVIRLRYIEGKSIEEITHLIGGTHNGTKSIQHRALSKMAGLISREDLC